MSSSAGHLVTDLAQNPSRDEVLTFAAHVMCENSLGLADFAPGAGSAAAADVVAAGGGGS